MPFSIKIVELMWRFNDLYKIRNIMARLCKAQRAGNSDMIRADPTPQDYKEADWWMAWISMPDTIQALNGKSKNPSPLVPVKVEGLMCVQGRLTPRALKMQACTRCIA